MALETAEEFATKMECAAGPKTAEALIEADRAAVRRELLDEIEAYCEDWSSAWAVQVMCEKLREKYAKEPR